MRRLNISTSLLLGILLSGTMLSVGCRSDRGYYDPDEHTYHSRESEAPHYSRWEQDTHRQHKDLDQRSQDEQKQYWQWRHRQH